MCKELRAQVNEAEGGEIVEPLEECVVPLDQATKGGRFEDEVGPGLGKVPTCSTQCDFITPAKVTEDFILGGRMSLKESVARGDHAPQSSRMECSSSRRIFSLFLWKF